jgi:hypothetical protein
MSEETNNIHTRVEVRHRRIELVQLLILLTNGTIQGTLIVFPHPFYEA